MKTLNFYFHIESKECQKSSIRVGTADLLNMLTTNEPNVDFTLALGTDTFIDLASGKWRRTEEVFKLVGHRMIVFRRISNNDNDDGEGKEEMIQQCIAKWQLLHESKSSIQLVTIPSLSNVSSSAVRSTKDETVLKGLICEPVLEYMKQNKLYAFADDTEDIKVS